MKNLAMLLLLGMFVGAPLCAQDKVEEKPAVKEVAKTDAFKIYRTKGNTWTQKNTAKYGTMEIVSYTKYEVTEVTEEKAVVKLSTLNAEEKETYSSTYDVKFNVEVPKDAPKEAPKEAPKTVEEKIKVAAGEFDCIKVETESEAGGMKVKTTTWTCKTYHIVVKSETKSDMGSNTLELTKAEVK
ncbi:MAG: hypothetical protein KF754_08905 [Planctomycetes bacterium]|nr:hypothetical protein [Planctomycetota bacterium]